MMNFRQRGISLIGMILVAVLLSLALLIGFKTVGPYKEYFSLERIIGLVSDEGNNGATESEMRKSYERRATVDSIDAIKPADLVIRKEGGRVVIEVEYTRKVPLVSNVSLAFDFKASSRHGRK